MERKKNEADKQFAIDIQVFTILGLDSKVETYRVLLFSSEWQAANRVARRPFQPPSRDHLSPKRVT